MEYNLNLNESELVELLANYTIEYTAALNNNIGHEPLKTKIDAIVAELYRRKGTPHPGDIINSPVAKLT